MQSKPQITDTATVTDDRLSVAPERIKAPHYRYRDADRQRIGVLADEGVIERLLNARFDQDECRLRYLRWLRDPVRGRMPIH